MKIINPSFEIWEQPLGKTQEELLNGIYKQIERAGRICYKSEDKITEDSAKPFVERLIMSGHYAMLEHGTIYLDLPNSARDFYAIEDYASNKYSRFCIYEGDDRIHNYVTTNLRVIIENGWEEDLQYVCEPTKYHYLRHTVHFTLSRQIAMEFLRHRVFSFAMESTRYCNYTKDKFEAGLTFIQPSWWAKGDKNITVAFEQTEMAYRNFINMGWTPQQAAIILPNALKTELVMTGFDSDWTHFFNLRALGTTGAPHPQAKELAEPLMNEFYERKYL